MKIESFRELLLKKAHGDPNLQSFVRYVRDDLIADYALEVLEKMARSSHKGDTANLPMRDFATEMDPETEPHMLRDALGHHVSHYKAALKAKNQGLANQHAKQAFRLMNLADRVQKHTGGKLSFEHVSPHAWERNKQSMQQRYAEDHPKVKEGKYKPGDFTIKTKGLNYGGSDFSHLAQPPFTGKDSYKKEIERHGHNKAYPFEHIRVNGKYIPIDENVDISTGYKKHPFDYHPIVGHFDDPAHSRTPEKDQRYIAERDKYLNEHPHIADFFNRHAELEQKDPKAYAERGLKPGSPVHEFGEEISNAPAQPGQVEAAPAQVAAPEQNMDEFLASLSPENKKLIDAFADNPELRDSAIKHLMKQKGGKK